MKAKPMTRVEKAAGTAALKYWSARRRMIACKQRRKLAGYIDHMFKAEDLMFSACARLAKERNK